MQAPDIYGYSFAVRNMEVNDLGVIGPGCDGLKIYASMSRKIIAEGTYGLSLSKINNRFPRHMRDLSRLIKENFPKH